MGTVRDIRLRAGINSLHCLTDVRGGNIFPAMPDKLQDSLGSAILRLLRPLARLLLKHGMPYGMFAELARKAYVDEAFEHLQRQPGTRPTPNLYPSPPRRA